MNAPFNETNDRVQDAYMLERPSAEHQQHFFECGGQSSKEHTHVTSSFPFRCATSTFTCPSQRGALINMLDLETPSAGHEHHFFAMNPSCRGPMSSGNIPHCGGQSLKEQVFQCETRNFAHTSQHGGLKITSPLLQYQKGQNFVLPNSATGDHNVVRPAFQMLNPFYSSDKAIGSDGSSFIINMKQIHQSGFFHKKKKIHQSGSSGLNGFQQVGDARISFNAAFWNTNDKHHKWTMQNQRERHPLSQHHPGYGYDRFIVMPRGRNNVHFAYDSSRPIVAQWDMNGCPAAIHILDDSDDFDLSVSTEMDTNLGDEYNDEATTENVESSAGGKYVIVVERPCLYLLWFGHREEQWITGMETMERSLLWPTSIWGRLGRVGGRCKSSKKLIKAVHIEDVKGLDNNENTLSLSTETDTNLGDEYDEEAPIEDVKGSAVGKSVTFAEDETEYVRGHACERQSRGNYKAGEDHKGEEDMDAMMKKRRIEQK
ncbi:hypothetical protein Cni_G21205 [Canna indica]|uniref:Uncharacterized protein n=1 Tax=Canna indica TaxID=4628 RepID=A0AAQ3KP21_9LILI|nr:hypothetical protein Cni_G21205 [Canna indica]